jgi:LytR cell envelope-related transcriptional attenuator
MSGRHEPPNKRSFYFSLGTSVLRFAIVVALVVGGIVVIDSAFSDTGGGGTPNGPGVTGPTATAGPTAPTGPTGTTGGGNQAPQIVDMNVAVRNGTGVSGLASETAAKLEDKYGVNAIQVDDAPSSVSVTTIYYRRPSSQGEAEYLAQKFFKKIEPQIAELPSGSGVDKDVELAIYLGTDYATSQS